MCSRKMLFRKVSILKEILLQLSHFKELIPHMFTESITKYTVSMNIWYV